MLQRGRKSSSALALAELEKISPVERVKPPHDLMDEEVEIWSAVVSTEPADWFSPTTIPLLSQYCRHVIQAKRIAELIERATSDPNLTVKDYNLLLKMQDREGRAMTALATRMRLTQQSLRNDRGHQQKPSASRKPWQS